MSKKPATTRHGNPFVVGKSGVARSARDATEPTHDGGDELASLLNNLSCVVYRGRNDRDRSMEFVSEGCVALTGYSHAAFLAGAPTYGSIVHAADRNHVWEDVQAALGMRRSFQITYRIITAAGAPRWVWEQGRGVYDADQTLRHVEGFIVDISEHKLMEQCLRESEERFRALSNLSTDWYWEGDAQYRFVTLEGRLVERDVALYRNQIGKTSWDVGIWIDGAENHEDNKNKQLALFSRHKPYYNVEMYTQSPDDGSRAYLNTSAEPRFGDNGEFIGYRGVTRNITKRKFAEQHILRLGRMYAALSATNEAILHAQSPEDLYQKVCDAAVHGGKFILTGIALVDPGTPWAKMVALTGAGSDELRAARISVDGACVEGQGTVGEAYRSGRPCISNDYLNDARMRPWREKGKALGVAAAAAIPLLQSGRAIGAWLFYSGEVGAFDDEIVKLLTRMTENVSFALDNIAREREQQLAAQALRESEARFKSLTELSSDWYWEQDAQYRFTRFDGRYVERSRGAFERLVGSRPWECGLENAPGREIEKSHRRVLEQRKPFHNAVVYAKLANDERICMSISGTPIFDAQGEFMGYRGTGRDITARMHAEAEMLKLSSAMEQTADTVMITDRAGVIEYVNAAFERTTGYTRAETLGHKPNLLKSGVHGVSFYDKLWRTVLAGDIFRDVFISRRKNGALYHEEKTISPLRDERGNITHFISTGKDITERMQAQERLQHIAHHDALTGLPNRVLLLDRLDQALARAHWQNRVVGVMFLDLDRFKNVNDTLGHDVGDGLLKAMAARLQGCVRERDSVARLGGDEFAILLEDVAHAEDISGIAGKILGAFATPFSIQTHELFITTSIGISMYPTDGTSSATLLKNADAAMYRAKDLGKNNYQFYSADLSTAAFERLTLETSLRRALERGEFVLHYQPQVDINSGQIIGIEALLRWQHPDFGLLAPTQFIAIAEETGAIVPIGEWVARSAMLQTMRWRKAGFPLRIAVNVSSRQFNEPSFLESIAFLLEETGLPADALELEITESVIMKNADVTIERLHALHAMGVRFAIDDFGTGYSSLSYLRRFAIHTLKVDKSFVRDIVEDGDDVEIVKTIIMMARGLRLSVVAEGVETREQLMFLKSHGCHSAQGHLICRPLSVERMTERLHQARTLPWLP